MKEFTIAISNGRWLCRVFYKGCCLASKSCVTLLEVEKFEDLHRWGVK